MPVQSKRSDDEDSQEFAERRHMVKQRALELKRALLASRSSPRRAVRAHDGATRVVRLARSQGGSFLRFCLAMLCGAVSMLVPVSSQYDLHGLLGEVAQAGGTTVERRAWVSAHLSECTRLSVHEPASVTVDSPALDGSRFVARIVQLVPQPGSAVATCRVELQLSAAGEQATLLHALPAESAVLASVPSQPTSWLVAIADTAASDQRVARASTWLRGYGLLAWQHSRALVGPALSQHWETLRQIVTPEG